MSVFDRLSKIITPPPRRKISPVEEAKDEKSFEPREDPCVTQLKSLLPQLLSELDEFSPEVQSAVAQLESLARTHGPYKAAMTLHQMVVNLRDDQDDEDEFVDRKRGFSFAGDLYLIHLKQCIASIKTKPMGPRVFQDYFVEILDCYHAADHRVKAVEAAIRIAEKLWAMSIELTEHNETYLAFADGCMQTATQVCAQKLEQDRLTAYRMKRQSRSGLTPPPTRVTATEAMNPALLDHLNQVKEALDRGHARNMELLAVYAKLKTNPVAGLQRIWELARHVNYAGLAGPMIERMTVVLGTPLQPDAAKMAIATANACEGLAAAEMKLELGGLARSHVAAALRLYRAAGDGQDAARVEQMLQRQTA